MCSIEYFWCSTQEANAYYKIMILKEKKTTTTTNFVNLDDSKVL